MKQFLITAGLFLSAVTVLHLAKQEPAVAGKTPARVEAQFEKMQLAFERKIADLELKLDAVRLVERTPAVEERIIDLPEDGHTWHTILILRPEWQSIPAERSARTIFFTEKGLISLRQQTHWHEITTDSAAFAPFRQLVDATPCLIVERANGQVVYRESGPQLGRNNDSLRRAIQHEVQRRCPDGRCLPVHPVPGPNPAPVDEVPVVLQEVPKLDEPAKAPDADRNLLPAILVSLGTSLGSLFLATKTGR